MELHIYNAKPIQLIQLNKPNPDKPELSIE
jgi:hypothetical protein